MPETPNVFEPAWEAELPAPFLLKGARVGAHAGAQELGATVYELAPGGAVSPFHIHHGTEEMLVVLGGRPTLRTPEGKRELAPGAVAAFPRGAAGAHQVSNESDEPARVLMISTMSFPDVAEHLDTGATLVIEGLGSGKVFPAGSDISVEEALERAMGG